jgi:hypothetical protein
MHFREPGSSLLHILIFFLFLFFISFFLSFIHFFIFLSHTIFYLLPF